CRREGLPLRPDWLPPRPPGALPRWLFAAVVAAGLAPAGVVGVLGVWAGAAFAVAVAAGAAGVAAGAGAAAAAIAALIAAADMSFRSHSGLGACGVTATSLVFLPKPSMSTVMVQTPSSRSGNEYMPFSSVVVATFLSPFTAVTDAPGTGMPLE